MLTNLIKSAVLLCFILSVPNINATKLPIEAYSAMPVLSLLRLSPDGDRIAYRSLVKEEDFLIIKNLNSGQVIGAVNLSKINPDEAYFVDQDRIILVGSANNKIYGYRGRHDISTAFVYDIKQKSLEQLLVQGRGIYAGQTALGRVVGFSPDLEYVYMPAYVENDRNAVLYSLMRVNLKKPRRIKAAKRGRMDTIDYFLNMSGDIIARERYNNRSNIHSIDALVDGDWEEIFTEESEIRNKSFVGITPDGKSLVMVASPDGEQNAYYAMSLKDGNISEPLFYRKDASIESVLSDKHRVVYGVRYGGFKPDYAFFDETLNKTYRAVTKAMPNNTFTVVDSTPDWKKILFYMEGSQTSGVYLMLSEGKFSFVASARPSIDGPEVAEVNEYQFNARDGLTIPTLLTYPKGSELSNEKLPAILMPHGGPQSHDKITFDWMAQYFASRGFVVIQPQFRGSDGFGREFTRKGHGEWGKKMQDDLTDAVLDLVNKNVVDKNRVCIVGWSYGGYAALAGAVFTPELYRCVVSINGVSDIKEMMRTEKREHGKHHWVLSYWNKVIRDKKIDNNYFETISPINFVKDIQAPILLVHGEEDTIVPIQQSEDIYEELEDAGKQVKFLTLKKEGHSISNRNSSRLELLTEIDKFIQNNIQP